MAFAETVGQVLKTAPTKKKLGFLFFAAFLVRAATFFFYMQYNERYNQGDTFDYHSCAVGMANDQGMYINGQPRFWRVPGYPFYLSMFYKLFGVKSYAFNDSRSAQMVALWLQILISSLFPIIIFYLAMLLTGMLPIAWIMAWISIFHLGSVIESSFLMTDAFGVLLFYLYLIFLFSSFSLIGEAARNGSWWKSIALAAATLGIATWIRPMGNYVYFASMFLLIVFGKGLMTVKLKKMLLFTLIFFSITGPWYVRNYQLTGKWFFCPMFGLYFNTYVAPKIACRLNGETLEENWKRQQQLGQMETMKVARSMRGSGYLVVPEIEYGRAAWPLISAHPLWALQDWMKQVFVTLFDTFSNQHIVDLARGSCVEPLEVEFVEKFKKSLYKAKMSWFIRFICWLEFLFTIFIWLGMFAGFFVFVLWSLFKRFNVAVYYKQMAALWFKVGIFIGAVCFMTGGYGYARLRLPVDLLIIILSLTFWYWVIKRRDKNFALRGKRKVFWAS